MFCRFSGTLYVNQNSELVGLTAMSENSTLSGEMLRRTCLNTATLNPIYREETLDTALNNK